MQFGTSLQDRGEGVAVGSSGNVYAPGFIGNAFMTLSDMFLTKYLRNGIQE